MVEHVRQRAHRHAWRLAPGGVAAAEDKPQKDQKEDRHGARRKTLARQAAGQARDEDRDAAQQADRADREHRTLAPAIFPEPDLDLRPRLRHGGGDGPVQARQRLPFRIVAWHPRADILTHRMDPLGGDEVEPPHPNAPQDVLDERHPGQIGKADVPCGLAG